MSSSMSAVADMSSSSSASAYPFEGCEKRLVIRFKPYSSMSVYSTDSCRELHRVADKIGDLKDLRNITTSTWSTILQHAQCSILNTIMNKECIAHLLSESSLFVYRDHLMIKTCGTTSVLHLVSALHAHCELLQLAIDHVFYSRSSFMFPAAQPVLYQDFSKEVAFLDRTLAALYAWDDDSSDDGQTGADAGVTFGVDGESQWHCCTRQVMHTAPSFPCHQTLELVMFDLEPQSLDVFHAHYRAGHQLEKAQVDAYVNEHCSIPGDACVDSFLFDPCGYSLNAIMANKYWSIHITPEVSSSFISFETNFEYDIHGDDNVIERMLRTFKPKRFGFAINAYGKCCNGARSKKELCDKFTFQKYTVTNDAYHSFGESHSVRWMNYVQHTNSKSHRIPMLMFVFSVLLAMFFVGI